MIRTSKVHEWNSDNDNETGIQIKLYMRGGWEKAIQVWPEFPARGNLPIFPDEYVGKIKTYLLFLSSYESFPASKNTYLFVPNLAWGYEAWDVLKWRKYWAPGILTR